MKSIKKLKAKIAAAMAARSNILPTTSREAREFFGILFEQDLSSWPSFYDGYLRCYLVTPSMEMNENRKARAVAVRVLFAFFRFNGYTTEECRRMVAGHLYRPTYYPPYVAPAPVPFAVRARARKLTPKGRGYRTAIGIEIEGHSPHSRDDLAAALPLFTKVVYDGSIEVRGSGTAAEVVALLNRDEMEPRLHRLCAKLNQMGFNTNKSCGLHVHIDCRHLSFEQVCVRAKIIDKWIKALVELVPVSRRDNRYCKIGFSSHDRYRAVNVTSYSKHQTLEIRIHSSTSNYQKALAWIRLCELLFGLRKAPKAATGCLSTLDQLPLAEYERSYWRARHAQLNPAQYMGAVVSPTGGEE